MRGARSSARRAATKLAMSGRRAGSFESARSTIAERLSGQSTTFSIRRFGLAPA
jgi:hypothetical protein